MVIFVLVTIQIVLDLPSFVQLPFKIMTALIEGCYDPCPNVLSHMIKIWVLVRPPSHHRGTAIPLLVSLPFIYATLNSSTQWQR